MRSFSFTTRDNVPIAAWANEPPICQKRLVCFHMMPATKESFRPFMAASEKRGWLVWAIDFRGHGESVAGGRLDYRHFDAQAHRQYVIEAQQVLKLLGETGEVHAIVGASIGANIAAVLQAEHELKKSVLLSPGLDYGGIKPQPALQRLAPTQEVIIFAGKGDVGRGGQAVAMAQTLFDATATPEKRLEIVDGTAHGTDIWLEHPATLQETLEFLE